MDRATLLAARDWTDLIGTQLVFGLTVLILNYSFYRSQIVPRWISVWGFLLALGASVPFWYTAIPLFVWDRNLGYRKNTFRY